MLKSRQHLNERDIPNSIRMKPIDLTSLNHGIIVSVQAAQGEPLDRPDILTALAESALAGGACGLRMAQPENLRYFKERHPSVPLIGITKQPVIPDNAHELVYITPTFSDVQRIADACDIVAMDATQRPRPDGSTLADIVARTRQAYPNLKLMADVATVDEGLYADALGFDLVSTTLSGYTQDTLAKKANGPDFALLETLVRQSHRPILMEGRLWEPAEVHRAFELGAFAVVIGSAVSRPHEITRRFVQAIPSKALPS